MLLMIRKQNHQICGMSVIHEQCLAIIAISKSLNNESLTVFCPVASRDAFTTRSDFFIEYDYCQTVVQIR